MTSHERFEPDTHRSDETAPRLHLVHEDREVINVSGVSVDPTAVEEVLNRHPKVAKAAAIGVPDAGTGEWPSYKAARFNILEAIAHE